MPCCCFGNGEHFETKLITHTLQWTNSNMHFLMNSGGLSGWVGCSLIWFSNSERLWWISSFTLPDSESCFEKSNHEVRARVLLSSLAPCIIYINTMYIYVCGKAILFWEQEWKSVTRFQLTDSILKAAKWVRFNSGGCYSARIKVVVFQ